jgi:Fanconi anemia group D2 protein
MCETILKEMKTYDKAHDYKVIDIWLLLIIYANGGPYKKVAESILKRKAAAGVLGKNLFNQCIKGRLSLLEVSEVI